MATIEGTDMSSIAVYSSLVVWLENCLTLNETTPTNMFSSDISDMADGIAIAECLQQLAPNFFNRSWRSKIIPEASASWRLKLSNLKKILKSIEDYYSDSLHLSLSNFPRPEVQLIAEKENSEHMSRLLQLVLGIAVHCDHKEKYIQGIMKLEKSVQHTVMTLIQELMSLESPSVVQIDVYRELEEKYEQTVNEFKSIRTENEEMKQKFYEANKKYSEREDELAELTKEVDQLKDKVRQQDDFGTPGGVKLQRVHRKLENIKSEKEKMEEECDDLQERIGELEQRLLEAENKNEELLAENAELPLLRDTVEELRYLESKVKNYESVISQYKKKVEDMQEMRKQLKSLEEKNVLYMQQNLDLEEELRRVSSFRSLMDSQKKKITVLENELAKEKLKSLESTQDVEDKTNIIETQTVEISELRNQLSTQHSLPSTPIQSQATLFSEMLSSTSSVSSSSVTTEATDFGGGTLMEAYTPALKEKMARLEKENEILRQRLATDEQPHPSVLPQYDETDHMKQAEKSAHVEKLERVLKNKLQELAHYKSNANQFSEQLKAKDTELDKYKKYLNKAKKIIEGFGDRRTDTALESAEIQQLKSLLQEREKEIERLEKSMEQDRGIREREERLILSAWYNLGIKYHQQQSKERLQSQASFLQQQRQASLKRVTNIQ